MRHDFEVVQVSFYLLQSHLADSRFVSSPITLSGASGNLPGSQGSWPRQASGPRRWWVGWEGLAVLPSQFPWGDLSCMELDRTLEDDLPRSVGAQYATGNQWRNNSRKNEEMEPEQNNTQLWMWLVIEAMSEAVKSNIAQEPEMLGPW